MNRSKIKTASSRQQGFTLVELMVTVAIVAILAAIAIPSYRQHVIRANRTAAESFMLQVANKQEQYLLDARTYTATLGAGGLNLAIPADVQNNYNVTIGGVSNTAYIITATPINPPQNDVQCGTLTLDQTGTKTSSIGSAATCW